MRVLKSYISTPHYQAQTAAFESYLIPKAERFSNINYYSTSDFTFIDFISFDVNFPLTGFDIKVYLTPRVGSLFVCRPTTEEPTITNAHSFSLKGIARAF